MTHLTCIFGRKFSPFLRLSLPVKYHQKPSLSIAWQGSLNADVKGKVESANRLNAQLAWLGKAGKLTPIISIIS